MAAQGGCDVPTEEYYSQCYTAAYELLAKQKKEDDNPIPKIHAQIQDMGYIAFATGDTVGKPSHLIIICREDPNALFRSILK